jgi:DNA polymerase III sliding clamp (beta) subunit (PCNA family)
MIAVATNGRRLTVIYHEQNVSAVPDGFGVIVPTAELLMAAKSPINKTFDVVFQVGPIDSSDDKGKPITKTRIALKSAITVEVDAIEGKFPDYQKVIPPLKDRKHSGIASVQVNYLADYAKLAALLKPGKSNYHEITVSAVDPNSSVVVGLGVQECVCILMPMRTGSDDFTDRDWLSSAKPAKAKAA